MDLLLCQRRPDLFGEHGRMALLQPVAVGHDLLELLQRAEARSRGNREAGGDTPLQPGHPHHEEFIQVGCEDREEAHPFQQEQIGVLRKFQDACVEVQPADLPVQEAVRRDIAVRQETRRKIGDVDAVLGGARRRNLR